MSGGRVELGLGAGWYQQEHEAHAVPFPASAKERMDRLEEQLTIMRGMWTTPVGESFSYTGSHYTVKDSPGLPRPLQSPHPPVIVGGSGPVRTPRLAAEYADEFNVPPVPHDVSMASAMFGRVRAACERIGRDPSSLSYSVAALACVGADEAEVERRANAIGHPVDAVRARAAVGTPKEVVDKLNAYAEAGCDRVYLQVFDLDDLDHLRLIAAEVAPHV